MSTEKRPAYVWITPTNPTGAWPVPIQKTLEGHSSSEDEARQFASTDLEESVLDRPDPSSAQIVTSQHH